jgi:hypothetical protein
MTITKKVRLTKKRKIKILRKCFNSDHTDYLLRRNEFIVDGKLTETGEELFLLVKNHYKEDIFYFLKD